MSTRFERIGRREHGSPYDRGASDSYYGRGNSNPHKWVFPGTEGRQWDEIAELTETEHQDYLQGYDDNEAEFHFKNWD